MKTLRERRRPDSCSPKVGLFGALGSGNLGNDASMEAVLNYVRARIPAAHLDAMCTGPEAVRSNYGICAIPMCWYQLHEQHPSRGVAFMLKGVGKFVDAFRTMRWVRRHDVVIVPGMGILETTMPLRALGWPYSLFLVSVCGRLVRTKVALVSVGANVIEQPLTRWLLVSAARFAAYRSFRDTYSRDAMRQQNLCSISDRVYPDIVLGIPLPPLPPVCPENVAVGVMDFYGSNDNRRAADLIHASYVEKMKRFTLWLIDSGRNVTMLIGDSNGSDDEVVQEILDFVHRLRPGLAAGRIAAPTISSFPQLLRTMATAHTVVTTRYHNLICAFRLAKPVLSIGYGAKHDALMAEAGLSDFCQRATDLNLERMTTQFAELECRARDVQVALANLNEAHRRQLDDQFVHLSRVLFDRSTITPFRVRTRSSSGHVS